MSTFPSTSSQVNRARNADQAARTCETFVYSIVKITRLLNIIKHGRHIFREIHAVRKGLWAFFLDCAFRMLIGWADKLRSRGNKQKSPIMFH